MFIDIHCHLEFFEDQKINDIIKNCREKNIRIIIYNSVDLETMKKSLELSKKYPEIKAALGIYPIDALKLSKEEFNNEINFIKKNKNKIISIGEIGIDLKESDDFATQKINFIKLINLANELDLPITVHSRAAEEKVIDILENNSKGNKIIMHCFCGSFKLIERIIKNNWYLSIPTNITFSEHFQKLAKICPIEQMFCETDSPFLHPVKGKSDNDPSNIIESYKKIAEIKRLSLNEVEQRIVENYNKLFMK